MRSPIRGEALHCLSIWEGFQVVDDLEALSDAEVADREYVEPSHREDKEHVHRPLADTFDLREVRDDFLTLHLRERAVFDGARFEFLREVFHVADLLERQAAGAKPAFTHPEHLPRRGALAGEEGEEA